ncbi:MAG: sporulation integral membrane protein YtvI [Firmicutes bacterium]|nr:sporulation integral membrane protein YtvI [Bacillota bacterium]
MNILEQLTPKRILIGLVTISSLALFVIFSKQFAASLAPFITAIILAAILEPIISTAQKKLRLPRGIAVISTLICFVLVIGYILFAFTTTSIAQLNDLLRLLPQYRVNITRLINDLVLRLEVLNEDLPEVVSQKITQSLIDFLATLEQALTSMITYLFNAFTGLPVFTIITLIVVVSTYFISKDKDLLIESFLKLVPESWKERIDHAIERIGIDLMGFIKGRLIMFFIATVISALGLLLLNIRYWLLLAIIIAVLDNIPIVGPGIIFGPWALASFLLGDTNRAIWIIVLYIVIFAVRQLTEPKIMGDFIGIHPLAMLLAFYAGVVFFGSIGIFIGPLLVIVIKAAIHAGVHLPRNE